MCLNDSTTSETIIFASSIDAGILLSRNLVLLAKHVDDVILLLGAAPQTSICTRPKLSWWSASATEIPLATCISLERTLMQRHGRACTGFLMPVEPCRGQLLGVSSKIERVRARRRAHSDFVVSDDELLTRSATTKVQYINESQRATWISLTITARPHARTCSFQLLD